MSPKTQLSTRAKHPLRALSDLPARTALNDICPPLPIRISPVHGSIPFFFRSHGGFRSCVSRSSVRRTSPLSTCLSQAACTLRTSTRGRSKIVTRTRKNKVLLRRTGAHYRRLRATGFVAYLSVKATEYAANVPGYGGIPGNNVVGIS